MQIAATVRASWHCLGERSPVSTAIDTLTLRGYTQVDMKRYGVGIVERAEESVQLTQCMLGRVLQCIERFAHAVEIS